MPYPQACTSSTNSFKKSGKARTGEVIRASFNCWKVALASSN